MTAEPPPSPTQVVHQLHSDDPIAAALGVELLEVRDATVTLAMEIDDRHVGGHGRVHGGVLFTLADIAMSYVGNRIPGQAFAVHASVDFVGPAELGDLIIATAAETSVAGRNAIYDATLTVDGRPVALFRGNTRRVR